MGKLTENSIEIMITLTAGIIFDILTIIYNVLNFFFGIGVVIGPVLNFIPLLFFSIFSLVKVGTEEIRERISTESQDKNSKEKIQETIGKTKKTIRLIKELWESAKAYAKSATPFLGFTFPWTRKALGQIWKQYAHL